MRKSKQFIAKLSKKTQYPRISAISSGNVNKYEFLTGKDALPENDLLHKGATMKRFEN